MIASRNGTGGEKLTYKEAAERFGVSEWTLYSWAARGLIRKYRKPLDRRVYVSVNEIERLRNAEPEVEEGQ